MSFKFRTVELYAGWRVCDETAQANMEQQLIIYLTVVILYFFLVVGNKFFFPVFPCLAIALHEQFCLKIPSIRRWNINGSPLFKVRIVSHPRV